MKIHLQPQPIHPTLLPKLLVGVATAAVFASAAKGVADTPPMGWRSWNSMHADVTQAKMERAMENVAQKRDSTGAPAATGTSLADLGFATVGLDDAWQACGTGVSVAARLVQALSS
jgi:hypothetical protein